MSSLGSHLVLGARQPASYSDWKSHQDSSTNADFDTMAAMTGDSFPGAVGNMDLDPYGSSQSFAGLGGASSYTTQPIYKTASQPYGNPSFSTYVLGVSPAYSAGPASAGSYATAGSALGSSYNEASYEPIANYQVAGSSSYPMGAQPGRLPAVTSAASRSTYSTSGAQGFSDDDYSNQAAGQFPLDPLYGRGAYNGPQRPIVCCLSHGSSVSCASPALSRRPESRPAPIPPRPIRSHVLHVPASRPSRIDDGAHRRPAPAARRRVWPPQRPL